jgi:hypothetical protein
VEARFTVASIDIFNEPNHLYGTLAPRNQEVLHTFMIAAQTGMVVDVYRDDGSSYSVESYSNGTILPFQVEVASSLRAFEYCA